MRSPRPVMDVPNCRNTAVMSLPPVKDHRHLQLYMPGGEVDVRGCYTAMATAHMLALDKQALAGPAGMADFVTSCQVWTFPILQQHRRWSTQLVQRVPMKTINIIGHLWSTVAGLWKMYEPIFVHNHCLAVRASSSVMILRSVLQTYEGGLGGEPGNEAHGGYTFCGLAALMLVDQAHRLNLPALLHFAVRCQVSQFFSRPLKSSSEYRLLYVVCLVHTLPFFCACRLSGNTCLSRDHLPTSSHARAQYHPSLPLHHTEFAIGISASVLRSAKRSKHVAPLKGRLMKGSH